MKTIGPMDVDYRIRAVAVVPEIRMGDYYMPQHQKIFYGLDAATIKGIQSVVFDVTDNFKGSGGRGPGNYVENEHGKQKHFFAEHLSKEHIRQEVGHPDVQADSHLDGVRASNGEGSAIGAASIAESEGSTRGGDQGPQEELGS